MKQIYLYMLMFLIFASCSTVQSDSDGGTSIEVVSTIKGVVKRSDSTVVENAKVSIISLHSGGDATTVIVRDTATSDISGAFLKEVSRSGALGVEVKDASGNLTEISFKTAGVSGVY